MASPSYGQAAAAMPWPGVSSSSSSSNALGWGLPSFLTKPSPRPAAQYFPFDPDASLDDWRFISPSAVFLGKGFTFFLEQGGALTSKQTTTKKA